MTEPAEGLELSLTAVAKLGAMVEGLFMRRACEVLIQLRKVGEFFIAEVTFEGTPVPGFLSRPCLGSTGNEPVRVRNKVGFVTLCDETVEDLPRQARPASTPFKVQQKSTLADKSLATTGSWTRYGLGAML